MRKWIKKAMEWTNKKEFFTSTPCILKVIEMVGLVTAMALFLVSNKCQSIPMYVSLYVLPIAVCLTFIFVSYTSAILVAVSGRNPFITPAWVKGESWLNVLAGLLMVVGSTLTLTRSPCSDTWLTVFSVALGYMCAIMFGCSGIITHLALVHQQEKENLTASKLEVEDDNYLGTLAAIF